MDKTPSPDVAEEVYAAALQAQKSDSDVILSVHGWSIAYKLRPTGQRARGDLRAQAPDGSAPIFSLKKLREKLGVTDHTRDKPKAAA